MTSSSRSGPRRWGWAEWSTVAVLALCPAAELLTGSEAAYSLALIALFVGCWALVRLPRRSVGFVWGDARSYGVACAYPVAVIGSLAVLAVAVGAGTLSAIDPGDALTDLGLMFLATVVGTLISEEGFFRGWLWAAVRASGRSRTVTLVWTSLTFSFWHLPVVIIEPNYSQTAAVIPVYMLNATLLGFAWGIMRLASGSIIVAAVSHGVWNALAYVLFGYGKRTGDLSVFAFDIYGPERGVLGLLLNIIAVWLLWRWFRARDTRGDSPAEA